MLELLAEETRQLHLPPQGTLIPEPWDAATSSQSLFSFLLESVTCITAILYPSAFRGLEMASRTIFPQICLPYRGIQRFMHL